MADPVEISNVGGYRGVASEATLLALVEAVRNRGLGGSSAGNERMVAKMQALHNKALSQGTKEVKAFDKAIGVATDSITDFTKELIIGGERVSDFADAILGSQNVLARFISFVDGTFDQFRSLVSVGASFNNSMLEMVKTSGEAFMTLDGFTEMVRNNSQALSRFGGTVTQGAQSFARFSRDFRMGIGSQFFEMGLTIADINEGLIGFLDLERMRTGRQLRSDAELQKSAANYLLQLDRLSKITGRQRRELEDALQREMQDAGMRAQLNRLEGQARENFANALMVLDTELAGPIGDGLKDLMDGVAQTDLGRALQSQIPGITEFAQQMFSGGASIEEIYSQLGSRFGPQLERLAGTFSKAQLDQMRMSGGVTAAIAEILDSSYQLNNLTERDAAAAAAEQQQRERITSTLGRFEQAIIAVRKYLFDAFLNSPFATALGDLGNQLVELFEGRGDGTFSAAMDVAKDAMNYLFGDSGIFTRAVRWFSNWVRTGGIQTAFESLKTTINEFVDRFSANVETEGIMGAIGIEIERLIDRMFGVVDDATGKRSGGIFQRLFDGFVGSEFWADFKSKFFDIVFDDANAQREGETFFDTIKRLVIDKLTGVPDSGLDLMTAISNKLQDIFLGPLTDTALPNGQTTQTRQGGLLDQLTQWLFNDETLNRGDFMAKVSEFAADALATTIQAFSTLLETSQPLINAISNGFNRIFDLATASLQSYIAENLTLPETNVAGSNTFWDRLYQKILDTISGNTGTIDLGSAIEARLTAIIESMTTLPEADATGNNSLWSRISQRIIDAINGEPGTETLSSAIRNRILSLIGAEQTGLNLYEDILNFIGLGGEPGEGILTRIERALGIHSTQIAGETLWDRMSNKINEKLFAEETGIIPILIQGFKDMMENQTVITNLKTAMTNLLSTISDGFVNYWEGSSGQRLMDSILNLFDDMFTRLLENLDSAFGLVDDEILINRRFEQFRRSINIDDGLSADERQRISDQIALLDMQKTQYEGILWDSEEVAVIDNQIRQLRTMLEGNQFAEGTNGFENFSPRGTPALLHGTEAVVPRNTPAGELLQAFYDMQNNNQPAPAPATTTSYNQSELVAKVDQLNSIMTQVAEILLDQRDIQTKTMRNIKGLGTDLFRGVA